MPTVLGAGTGATALLTTPAGIFEAVVPFLIAGSSLLLLGQPWIVARACFEGSPRVMCRCVGRGSIAGGMVGAASSASRGPTRCRRRRAHDGAAPGRVRHGQPGPRDPARGGPRRHGRRLGRSPASSRTTSCTPSTSSPDVFNRDVAPAVAAAVAEAAVHSSVARSRREPDDQPAGR